jgi:hypothetical protein
MRIRPVRHKAVPRYPTSDYLREHPELLYIVPERWRRNTLVLKILGGAACLLLASQTASAQQQGGAPPSGIAPLFLHGEGRAAFGCMAINPPVFLSEDEARQVIQEEAKKAGLVFGPGAFTVPDAALPVTHPYSCPSPDGKRIESAQPGTRRGSLTLDGFDKKRNVAYEFVSQKHYRAWEDKNSPCWSSVSSSDAKDVAEVLRAGLKPSAGQPWIVVFYEPFASIPAGCRPSSRLPETDWKARWEQCELAGKKLDGEQLRMQVRDFIGWLKAQGVI